MINEGKIYKVMEAWSNLRDYLPDMTYDRFILLINLGEIRKLTPRRIIGRELIKYLRSAGIKEV